MGVTQFGTFLVCVDRYKPAAEDQIMKAFEVLDQENKGYLTTEELTKYMSEEGKCTTW